MSNGDIFESFNWHSSLGFDSTLASSRKVVTRLPNSKEARSMFTSVGSNLLIHKTTRCLWKLSDDKKGIEPVFGNDILTEDDVKKAMEE
jgi:hypothetical protein